MEQFKTNNSKILKPEYNIEDANIDELIRGHNKAIQLMNNVYDNYIV